MNNQQKNSPENRTSRVMTEWPDSLKAFLFRLLGVFRHLLRRCALYRPTAQFLYHRFRGSAACMGEALRFIVDHRARLAPSFPLALLGRRLLSGMLTLISWLFGYVFRLRGRFGYLKYIPAFVFIYVSSTTVSTFTIRRKQVNCSAFPSASSSFWLAKPFSYVRSAGKNSRGCSPHRLTTVRSTNGKPWDSSSFWEPEPWV